MLTPDCGKRVNVVGREGQTTGSEAYLGILYSGVRGELGKVACRLPFRSLVLIKAVRCLDPCRPRSRHFFIACFALLLDGQQQDIPRVSETMALCDSEVGVRACPGGSVEQDYKKELSL